jgi:uncharacterized protein with LGFP repeats
VPPWQIAGLACTPDVATDNLTAEHSAPCLTPGCNGPVEQHYWNLGGPASFLGPPTTGLMTCPDGIGHFEHYQNGSIYWSPSSGAQEVHGNIRAKWAALGSETGLLGYPLTDESPSADGVGRFNHFQGGSIYWTPSIGAHEIHGPIRTTYLSVGGPQSRLRYPKTDVTPTLLGARSTFLGGYIDWNNLTGLTTVVYT